GTSYSLNSLDTYPSDGHTWVHIAATYDGATMRMYINGQESGTREIPSPASINPNTLPLTIGAGTNGAHAMQGAIDDVRIYNTALAAADIQALAETPPPPQGAPALAAPANLSTGVPTSPTLSWQPVGGAASYEVQVSAGADFSSPVFGHSVTTGTSVEVPGLGSATSYHWRVRASN